MMNPDELRWHMGLDTSGVKLTKRERRRAMFVLMVAGGSVTFAVCQLWLPIFHPIALRIMEGIVIFVCTGVNLAAQYWRGTSTPVETWRGHRRG